MVEPLSNCTFLEQQGVILLGACACCQDFIGEWQRIMVITAQHRKIKMNGWADLSMGGKLSMTNNNQAGLQSRTDDHCAEVDVLIEENLRLMDSGDDGLRFPPSFLLLYSFQLLF